MLADDQELACGEISSTNDIEGGRPKIRILRRIVREYFVLGQNNDGDSQMTEELEQLLKNPNVIIHAPRTRRRLRI